MHLMIWAILAKLPRHHCLVLAITRVFIKLFSVAKPSIIACTNILVFLWRLVLTLTAISKLSRDRYTFRITLRAKYYKID